MRLYEDGELIDLVNKKTNKTDFTGTIRDAIEFIRKSHNTTRRSVEVGISIARDRKNKSAYGYHILATKSR